MDWDLTRRDLLRMGIGAMGALGAAGVAGAAGGGLAVSGWSFLSADGDLGADAEILAENAKPGTFGWLNPEIDARIKENLNRTSDDDRTQAGQAQGVDISGQQRVEGYTDAMSVNTGEAVNLRVSSRLGSYVVSILRMGWYNGAGAREVYRSGALSGVTYPTPGWDGNGLVACNWPVALTVSTSGWSTGYYLAALIPQSTGAAESYVPFVVRNDASTAEILMQIPFTTYQAYNSWGGKSTYGGSDGRKAEKVSFDRPYGANGGTQYLFAGDHQMISWLERFGYPVTYAASSDTHRNPGLMNGRRLFLSIFHDEYWSQSMRNNLTSWIGAGKSMSMLSANNIYWRVRFEPNSAGAPDRTMVCYKDSPADPNRAEVTTLFSSVGQNEVQIEGLQFAGFGDFTAPWIVTNAGHWIYAGTGVSNGTAIAGLVGTEWDHAVAGAPADTQIIASSPTTGAYGPSTHAAAVREPNPGQVLFTAGSIRFPMYFGGYNSPGEDARVSRMFTNVLARIGVGNGQPPEPPTTQPPPPTTQPPSGVRGVAAQSNTPVVPSPRTGAPAAGEATPSGPRTRTGA
jgi:hypothetical protein